MAFVKGLDTYNPKKLGEAGSAIVGSSRKVYFTEDTDITNYNVVDNTKWNEIKFIEDFTATDSTNKIEIFDGNLLSETIEGKTTSEFKLTQINRGWLNSIGKLKGKKVWVAEGFIDGRDAKNTDGTDKIHEVRFVQATITSISEEKGDAEAVYKLSAEGSYAVTTQKRAFRGITPVNVTGTAGGTGTNRTVTVTGTDFANAAITLADLTEASLMGEITGISVEKVSGDITFTQAIDSTDDNKVLLTLSGTVGTLVVKAVVATANGGTFKSANITIV